VPGFGGIICFDATYAELSVGRGGGEGWMGTGEYGLDYHYGSLSIGLLGKYPFQLSSKFALFPMLGIDYRILLSREFYDGESNSGLEEEPPFMKETENGDFNALSIKLGLGFDVSFTSQIYLRVSTVFGYQLPAKFEQDQVDKINKLPGASAEIVSALQWDVIKLAVGFRF
jgi:hypothetical protein